MAPESTYFPLPERSFADLPDVLEDLAKRGVTATDVAVALEDSDNERRWLVALHALAIAVRNAGAARAHSTRTNSTGVSAALGPLRHGATSLISGALARETARLCEEIQEPSELRIPGYAKPCVSNLAEALETLSASVESSLPSEVLDLIAMGPDVSLLDRCRRLVQSIAVLGAAPDFARFYLSGWFPRVEGTLRQPSTTWLSLAKSMPAGNIMGACLLEAAIQLERDGQLGLALEIAEAADRLLPSCLHPPLLVSLISYEMGLMSKGDANLDRWYDRYWRAQDGVVAVLFAEAIANWAPRWRAVVKSNPKVARRLWRAPADLQHAIAGVIG